MEKSNILIGSHVSMNSPDFYVGSVKEALSYGANSFMFYTGAPQNSIRKPLNELKIDEGKRIAEENNIDYHNIIVHAPYIVNLANKEKIKLFNMSIDMIVNELKRTYAFGSKVLVLHPGSHVGCGSENGIKNLVEALNTIFSKDGTDVKIAIETMAGKGTEIGINFDEISEIIKNCKYQNRLGVCLDTCHIFDGGYDLNDIDLILNEFDQKIGINKILVVHLNDSKNINGSHKDRHENIGFGNIGFENLVKIAHHPKLINIPKILETPYINGKPPYKYEIDMIKSKKFINDFRDNF